MMTTKSGNNSNTLFKILLEGQYSNEFLKNRIRASRGSKTIKSHIFGAATGTCFVGGIFCFCYFCSYGVLCILNCKSSTPAHACPSFKKSLNLSIAISFAVNKFQHWRHVRFFFKLFLAVATFALSSEVQDQIIFGSK